MFRPAVTPGRIGLRLGFGLAILLVVAAYGGGWDGERIWDDHLLLDGNPVISGRQPWTQAFGEPFVPFDLYYRPVTVLVLRGLEAFPGTGTWPFHVASWLLHLACGAGIYALARRSTATPAAAAGASLLFLVHPAMVEAVAWISGIGDLLAAVFMLVSGLLWLDAARPGKDQGTRLRRLVFASLFGLAALFSKETALALPFLMILAWIAGSRSVPARVLLLAPLVLLAVYAAARWMVLPEGLGDLQDGVQLTRDGTPLSAMEQWRLKAGLLTRYVGHALLPVRTQAHPIIDLPGSWWSPVCWGGVAAFVALGIWIRRARVSCRHYLLPLAWFAITLVPAALLQSRGRDLFAERYLYIPLCGLAPLLAVLARGLAARGNAARVAGIVLLIGLTVITASRVRGWTREEDFLRRSLRAEPRAAAAAVNLGLILRNQGRWEEAAALYERTLQAWEADQRGIVTERTALSGCRLAYELGVIRARGGDASGAEAAFRKALRFDPDDERALAALGAALGEQGRYAAAREVLEGAVARLPDSTILRENLATAAALMGDSAEAARQRTILARRGSGTRHEEEVAP